MWPLHCGSGAHCSIAPRRCFRSEAREPSDEGGHEASTKSALWRLLRTQVVNRIEARLLRNATSATVAHNRHLWWEVKRQVFELGYQTYYPRQDEYTDAAKSSISHLPEGQLQELRLAYCGRHRARVLPNDDQVIDYYVAVMIEEIVRRARVAANRTINW